MSLSTPVVFLVFNRPHTTEKVFEQIRLAAPSKLLVVADGPRPGIDTDVEKCAAVRAIIDQVDWECEVVRNFSEVNLGCGRRVASGLDWAFTHVSEAIILEDDCEPGPMFFQFCADLLERYRHDTRIMMVSGTNLLGSWKSNLQSYHFSYLGGIWGWATWRRAWRMFDPAITKWVWPEVKARISDLVSDEKVFEGRKQGYDLVFDRRLDTWDYQWSFARLVNSGLSVVPSVNLVTNIGFGADATHTKNGLETSFSVQRRAMQFPLREPAMVVVDRDFDRAFSKLLGGGSIRGITCLRHPFHALKDRLKRTMKYNASTNSSLVFRGFLRMTGIVRRIGVRATPRPVRRQHQTGVCGPRRVVLLDSSVSATNIGNNIIMESVRRELGDMFADAFLYTVPMMEYVDFGRPLIQRADYVFLSGTNALCHNMNWRGNWRLRLRDLVWMRNVVLFGVGWWQYEDRPASWATSYRLRHVLSQSLCHAVRDGYTLQKLSRFGVNSLNCGCPTTWKLTAEHCAKIPAGKGTNAVITFTGYNQDEQNDRRIYEIIRRHYEAIYVWPQQYEDVDYAQRLCGADATVLSPTLTSLDDILQPGVTDYVGTRLHAGIRALQHRCRSIIIAVDNRAMEMANDTNLPVVPRESDVRDLERRIVETWPTRIALNENDIRKWKDQFRSIA